MTEPANRDHDEMIALLRREAAAADAPPPELAESAKAAFGLSRLEDELAELLHDTALEPAGLRSGGDGAPRMVSFGATEVAADVEIAEDEHGCTVTGMVSGPVSLVVLQTPDTEQRVDVDQHGRFKVTGVLARVLRFQLATRSGYNVVTPWVRTA
jgi:hypothetical protein